ncbi:TRAP transporter substrate-binding protein DctP [Azospirillum rugosum]|uniref:TRAP-type C4-dicarboxylate transport system substrate-binding protein n=1 Tax=Azospirillum rugosum TaxID=416170 RepID=A0ABS4SWQ9_9PROT|nr:TRAP transporter substrate-binding protein DctP [Azospirillum rugosum]MBP2296689.1 TRAP-type C4-dicarboxylate transport system substrate-binding protein [Azospirillum rugosum]MDQ0530498.1 TRAP-type C4-dicarboxylate transport system substrate-binding protein [Azospirillum rugosum]
MILSRRTLLGGVMAAPAIVAASRLGWAADARTLKISHQFPGGTLEEGDFRDRLCRKFAAEVEKRTNGALKFELYPNSSLMKTLAQFSAMRKGALDLSFYPMPYAGGEVPETNLGLMPCLVTSYEQGMKWRKAEIGQEMTRILDGKGIKLLTWIWQAGGTASRAGAVLNPADVKGMKIRGGSREMDMMLKEAGAAVSTIPSNELYAGMQTGAVDAAITSSTSLISFKLEELSKHLTAPRQKSYWYMLEPLMMSKSVFDSLPPDQQKVLEVVGEEMESFGYQAAREDDDRVAQIYSKAGVQVQDMPEDVVNNWRDIARATAWKDFTDRVKDGARLLKLAEQV